MCMEFHPLPQIADTILGLFLSPTRSPTRTSRAPTRVPNRTAHPNATIAGGVNVGDRACDTDPLSGLSPVITAELHVLVICALT